MEPNSAGVEGKGALTRETKSQKAISRRCPANNWLVSSDLGLVMQHRSPNRPFLARPFWRDYVLSSVLIGLGFMLTSPTLLAVPRVIGSILLVGGSIIFLCAISYSVLSTAAELGRLPSLPPDSQPSSPQVTTATPNDP